MANTATTPCQGKTDTPCYDQTVYPTDTVENGRRLLFATYKGDNRTWNGTVYSTRTIAGCLRAAQPGDIIQLLPGTYWTPVLEVDGPDVVEPFDVEGLCGEPEKPITIRGLGSRTQLVGAAMSIPPEMELPNDDTYAFFRLVDCAWIEFEDFHVRGCWPSFLYLKNSRYITVRNLEAQDSQYFIFGRGYDTHHILIEDTTWNQDPTGSLWTDIEWADDKVGCYYFYNGGILGSDRISGSVVLRGNRILNSFNAFRLKGSKSKEEEDIFSQNLNLEVYNNIFENTRDNPVEPEKCAVNWHIRHNIIKNAHAWFSFDNVAGGYWYIYGNRGYYTSEPGQPRDPNRGGKVFKFKYNNKMPYPSRPNYVFNNSFMLRSFLIKAGATKLFNHAGNIVLFCIPNGDPICNPDATFIAADFLKYGWDDTVQFDFDLTNKPFPERFTTENQEANGEVDPDFHFVDANQGNFMPASNPGTGRHIVFNPAPNNGDKQWTWPGWSVWKCPQNQGEDGPARGAIQPHGGLIQGPPFAFYPPQKVLTASYVEMPRIVVVDRSQKEQITLAFSWPLATKAEDDPILITVYPPEYPGTTMTVTATQNGQFLDIPIPKDNPIGVSPIDACLVLPQGLVGTNNQPLTMWSCPDASISLAPVVIDV
ncbi:right-handed parallel beta-helix repeat-containing protein [Desulfovibrio inopinatus]|uniref:right-handed parallel beta-helix repeat-containing protein n=1 Tax=Desulfovibrio inopinatus TaxID=102109 RepID=UPI00040A2B35|nr:right-handed parallel beta-helix repeat-containing protein [Desulfovibrio inopinatus]